MEQPPFSFDPESLPRETSRHYISASDTDLEQMLEAVGVSDLGDLFGHIPSEYRIPPGSLPLPDELSYSDVAGRIHSLATMNRLLPSFLGDGLPDWDQPAIVGEVAGLRTLATSYTPYQPERSQGTLISQWVYQCGLARLTGCEAVNASLYDRSTAMVEAALCAVRVARKADTVVVAGTCFPSDLEVFDTLLGETEIRVLTVPADPATGCLRVAELEEVLEREGDRVAAVLFPQVNQLGLLEPVDTITDTIHRQGALAIAVIDPFLLGTGGLKPPVAFGERGADMAVGEAQHLALAPNFGGPGLGLFAVRHHENQKALLRATPGRFVGKGVDASGKDCRVMVLSTREQHIRKDKATSNICSNQAFVATLAGAAMLARGEEGHAAALRTARERTVQAAARLTACRGVTLLYPNMDTFNELALRLPETAADFLAAAREAGFHGGVPLAGRIPGGDGSDAVKLTFTDRPAAADFERFLDFVAGRYGQDHDAAVTPLAEDAANRRQGAVGLPSPGAEAALAYFRRIAGLNIAPEDTCYPLGSCTMKYNPYLNEWAANHPGFTPVHPQVPLADAQGCLAILYETQQWVRAVTGLPAVATQPVAGAQGELVGLKLFQAYHRNRGEGHRNLVMIPESAHGTNFATATMAGYSASRGGGIVLLKADATGRIDRRDFEDKLARFGERLAGIMITNPNTGGVFEDEFGSIAKRVHAAGGLVYMDGANMNAIAGWVDLGKLGVDAVHNNLHKTWTIPHGGGGPGDAFVAVSEPLIPFLPGFEVVREGEGYGVRRAELSIGSFHRHWGNFAHKVRAYTYLLRLGREGVQRMSAVAVLAARYLHERLKPHFKTLPEGTEAVPRMHEFILSLREEDFAAIEAGGIPRAQIIPSIGKLFLDFGYHAPTVAFPEVLGLMIEPTESYRKDELDRFADAVIAIGRLARECPALLRSAPHFTPVGRIDEVSANRNPVLAESLDTLPPVHEARLSPEELLAMPVNAIAERLKCLVPVGA